MSRWQLKWWITGPIGALIGLGAFYCQYNMPREHAPHCSQEAFFKECLNWSPGQPPPFKDLVITPQVDGVYTIAGSHFSYRDRKYLNIALEVPATGDAMVARPGIGFMAATRSCASQCFWMRYQYQWWREPSLLIWAYPAIGAFLLGGVIPFLTFLWRGGAAAEAEQAYDLNRFSGDSQKSAPGPIGPTHETAEQLDAAIAAAQQGTAIVADVTPASKTALTTAPVRNLDDKPLADVPPTIVQTKKDFDGEFYPTEVHHHESKQESEDRS
jgi:hypothetical protein